MFSHSFLHGHVEQVGLSHCVSEVYVDDRIYHGQLHAKSCAYEHQLKVFGDAVIYHSRVNQLQAYGQVAIRQASRISDFHLFGNRAYLNQSWVGSITVQTSIGQPVVYLNHSVVERPITFKNQKGLVYMDHFSTTGRIINGEVRYV